MKPTFRLSLAFIVFSSLTTFTSIAKAEADVEVVGRCTFPTRSPDARPLLFPELNCEDLSAPICLSVSGCLRSRNFFDIQLHRIASRLASGKDSTYEYDLCTTMKDCRDLEHRMLSMKEMVAERIHVQETELTRSSLTGAVFTRETRFPELGETWRDPSGLVWGGVIPRGSEFQQVLNLSQAQGAAYCASKGARLPTTTEFERLRSYLLTAEHPMGRWQPVIPEIEMDYLFWTSDASPSEAGFHEVFRGASWEFFSSPSVPRNGFFIHSVRCVRH